MLVIQFVKITHHTLGMVVYKNKMRLPRLELGTSTLSVSRSNQLSYNRINGD
jgi:hypothetical protein